MLTSLIASLIVLARDASRSLNEWLDRRDRRRWSVLAQYVLFQLVAGRPRDVDERSIELLERARDRARRRRRAARRGRGRALDTAGDLGRDRARCSPTPSGARCCSEVDRASSPTHSRGVIVSWAVGDGRLGPLHRRSSTATSSCRGASTGSASSSRRSEPRRRSARSREAKLAPLVGGDRARRRARHRRLAARPDRRDRPARGAPRLRVARARLRAGPDGVVGRAHAGGDRRARDSSG